MNTNAPLASPAHAGNGTAATAQRPTPPAYAELHCLSNFSFQRGASSADELFARAKALGYCALAITDECSLAGIVRALQAAERHRLRLIVGSEITLADGPKCVLLCIDRDGYAALCRLLTQGRRATDKGRYRLLRTDVQAATCAGLFALWIARDRQHHDEELAWLHACFGERLRIGLELHRGPHDAAHLRELRDLSQRHGIGLLATGDVHMHTRGRRALQDTLVAIGRRQPVADCGRALFANGERHLRPLAALAELYPADALAESVAVAERCVFNLRELQYQYPAEIVPSGHTPSSHLRALAEAGARRRWPAGVPEAVRARIDKELALIATMAYEAFFLTVEDIVRWARGRGILCQGRGSAANSVVCYCLGITAVGPQDAHLLFERFISKERNEPPDIDVDFEHERREEVLQYVYGKYGRERAALAAAVVCYRSRSAVRDVAAALGFSPAQVDALAGAFAYGHGNVDVATRVREAGFDPDAPALRRILRLSEALRGFPRHLSQHVGGFVISGAPLWELVPVENAAMPERTIIQWDKDDLDALGLLKVDCLALGMLSCLRRCFELLRAHRGIDLDLASIPADDAPTWELLQRADTVGVFQVESRAQMAMLPRLRPGSFQDLTIELAIVRPGPIQGGMVHPYLQRRRIEHERAASGLAVRDEASADFRQTYHCRALAEVLGHTCGVPVFQEQVMRVLQVAADFSGGEADALRRSMAAWKREGGLEHFRERIVAGMTANGYPADFIERLLAQIQGFGSYGFPESHAASFALLAYASAWLKCHQPAAFACALLNSQPMGFYAPAQIVADARRHGVPVLPVDVLASDWDCSLATEAPTAPRCDHRTLCLRLGLRQIAGFPADVGKRLVAARAQAPFRDVADLRARTGLDARSARLLAAAGALRGLSGHRHRAYWEIADDACRADVLQPARIANEDAGLRTPSAHEDTFADYASTGLSLGAHPLALIRDVLRARCLRRADDLARARDGQFVRYAGLVIARQRPATASGVTFVTLEDECGSVNAIVWQAVAQRDRHALLQASVLGIAGRMQHQDGVSHLIAQRLFDCSDLLGGLAASSRDFH
ncbi:MAG: error-prone DNA polymerase [Proteobacteria bacterium]|nr:error-prone DNA polymerase [Pseudomonadota bacterium]